MTRSNPRFSSPSWPPAFTSMPRAFNSPAAGMSFKGFESVAVTTAPHFFRNLAAESPVEARPTTRARLPESASFALLSPPPFPRGAIFSAVVVT
ncbi:MAG TPA: hypothetical protein DCR11_09300 [Deltaproteobacteria bacterium]|nr:hypothetical protein [Deltaproteobacteria bacterium]